MLRYLRPLCVVALIAAGSTAAFAHFWYPQSCCTDTDCAPVTKMERQNDGSYVVTSEKGTVTIPAHYPNWRPSADKHFHVCMASYGNEYGGGGGDGPMTLICAFAPAGS